MNALWQDLGYQERRRGPLKEDLRTRVITPNTLPSISFQYKHSRVEQYLKEGLALWTETTFNDPYDIDIGRRIDNLPELRARGDAINAGLLVQEANAETARLEGPELTDLVRLTVTAGRRVAALRVGDPRVMALVAAVVMLRACIRIRHARWAQHPRENADSPGPVWREPNGAFRLQPLSHLPAGFSNAQLRRQVAALLSAPLGSTRAPG